MAIAQSEGMKHGALLLMLLATWLLSGCTFIGLGVGAATPRYVPTETVSVGDDVRVDTGSTEVSGDVIGTSPSSVGIASGGRVIDVPRKTIKTIERRSGTNWLMGLGIGFAIDATLATAVGIAVAVAFSQWHGFMGPSVD